MKTARLSKTKTALAALLLGASSVAMAQTFTIKTDLYSRSWNTFYAASDTYDADSVKWEFSAYPGGQISTSKSQTFTIQEAGTITLKLYAPTGFFIKSYPVPYINFTDFKGSSEGTPRTDSVVVAIDGLQLSAFSFLNADSIAWKVRNDITHDSTYVLYTGSEVNTPVTVTQNATVTAWVRSEGIWYQQWIQFNGITQNPISGVIQAPLIPNGTYTWYFEEDLLPVSGASYAPTQNGTYKVVITWPSTSNARLADGANRAEFLFEVTNVISTDLHSSSLTHASLALYPNPASESVNIANVGGEFDYTIHNAIGNEVARGTGFGNSEVNISQLNSGLYMVKIKASGSEVTKKLMVK